MPDDLNQKPIQTAWINYTKSVQIYLVPQPDENSLNQFLQFRDAVLAIVQGKPFIDDLGNKWPPLKDDESGKNISDALLLELKSFPLAVEVSTANDRHEDAKIIRKKMLDLASTVLGSVKDIIEHNPYGKAAITLFGELIDLFKGKG